MDKTPIHLACCDSIPPMTRVASVEKEMLLNDQSFREPHVAPCFRSNPPPPTMKNRNSAIVLFGFQSNIEGACSCLPSTPSIFRAFPDGSASNPSTPHTCGYVLGRLGCLIVILKSHSIPSLEVITPLLISSYHGTAHLPAFIWSGRMNLNSGAQCCICGAVR